MLLTKRTLCFLVVALALVCAILAEERSTVGEGGPCLGGFFPDGKGCCPDVIDSKPYWRDSNQCYPKDVGAGIYYADIAGYAFFFRVCWHAVGGLTNVHWWIVVLQMLSR
jgi:hypothetical protein